MNHFGIDVYTKAYAYCEENNLMSALFAACQDDKTEYFYKTLPFTYGKQTVACGEWVTRMEH